MKKIYFALSVFVFMFQTALTASQIVEMSDLKMLGKMQPIAQIETSDDKFIFQRKDGSNLIVKRNPLNLIVNEFVASAIYQLIIGPEVPTSFLVKDGSKTHFGFPPTPGFRPYSTDIETIDGFALRHAATKAAPAKLNRKSVNGLESALYASMLLNDEDIYAGNNFALVDRPQEYLVTRFDFDDSLKFFDSFKITKIRLPTKVDAGIDSRVPSLLSPLLKYGLKWVLFTSYKEPSLQWLVDKIPSLDGKLSSGKLRQVHETIAPQVDRIDEAIREAFAIVEENIDAGEILEFYDLAQLRFVAESRGIFINANDTPCKQLADFTVAMIRGRLAAIDEIFFQRKGEL